MHKRTSKTNAHRQKRYRQRLSLERLRNDFNVMVVLRECERSKIDIWPVILDCADEIFEHNGDGLEFARRALFLVYGFVSTRTLIQG